MFHNDFKKFFVAIVFVVCSFSKNSWAYFKGATDGHYLQASYVMATATQELLVDSTYVGTSSTWKLAESPKDTTGGFEIAYKYAYSFKDDLVSPVSWLYIAPGLFYENIQTTGEESILNNKISINNRYGASLDLGYDFDYGISSYFTGGVAAIDYEADWTNLNYYPDTTQRSKVSGTNYGFFYGAGVSYELFERVRVVLEYTQQTATIKALPEGDLDTHGAVFDRFYNKMKIMKLGISYCF